jgi:adenine-specific DNA-methyltransferase
LVTNNEDNICTDVCYPRIEKIIRGHKDKSGLEIPGLGGNLRYFRIGFIEKSNNMDEMKLRVAETCKDLIRLREGTFQELETSSSEYSIFTAEDKAIAIYASIDPSKLSELKEIFLKLPAKLKKIFVFAFDGDNMDYEIFEDWKDVQFEPIPQKLIELLGEINV